MPTFTLSWLLTWYSHVIDDLSTVQRIFDAVLSQHPLFTLYLISATILFNKETLYEQFEEDDPHTSLYMIFQQITPSEKSFDVEQIIQEAVSLLELLPPETLADQVSKK